MIDFVSFLKQTRSIGGHLKIQVAITNAMHYFMSLFQKPWYFNSHFLKLWLKKKYSVPKVNGWYVRQNNYFNPYLSGYGVCAFILFHILIIKIH